MLQQKKTIALARWLLGKHLVRRFADGREEARMILEVEAYNGEKDLACHARAGRTKRTEVMYGDGGVWYVYLCYGIHEMLNLVVGPRDFPAAILIRGVEGAIGPGRVTKSLSIDRQLNGAAATLESSGLWLEDRGVRVPGRMVEATPRIGVDYAGPIWTMKHWRFTFDPRALSSPPPGLPPAKATRAPGRAVARGRAAPAAPTLPGP
ncbi:MAG TPA: DNA-3-methyladenine glycosylase [Opitutaceae bacterium]|nr:DNA-3-methyladenine glycosylase [Opitutaceae bacterium]